MRSLAILLFGVMLGACQSHPESGGWYVYTDAQGNLVTVQQRPEQGKADQASDDGVSPSQVVQNSRVVADPSSSAVVREDVDDYRPSAEVEGELEARENDRFITYVDEMGQLVSRPLDMGAEREAANTRPDGFEDLQHDGYLETYRALRVDCCNHFLAQAAVLKSGKELLVEFDSDSPVLRGDVPYRSRVFAVDDSVQSVSLMSFIKKQDYLGVELLWLDEQGVPVMLVDQPFSRRYPETWYRYGYLQGTLEREPGQKYLVVFLPYLQGRDGTDGLKLVTDGELVLNAQ